jgi:hypothetical protein
MQNFPNATRPRGKEKKTAAIFESFDHGSAVTDGGCNDNRDAAGQDSASLQCGKVPATWVGKMNDDEEAGTSPLGRMPLGVIHTL